MIYNIVIIIIIFLIFCNINAFIISIFELLLQGFVINTIYHINIEKYQEYKDIINII